MSLTTGCRVNPLYYVTFTTATLCASFILFRGFNTTDAINTISLLCGFLTIFSGVYLLNLSRNESDAQHSAANKLEEDNGVPTDGIASLQTRRSMQYRRSLEHRRSSSSIAYLGNQGDREGLIRGYDVETGAFGLTELAEESDANSETELTSKINANERDDSPYRNSNGKEIP